MALVEVNTLRLHLEWCIIELLKLVSATSESLVFRTASNQSWAGPGSGEFPQPASPSFTALDTSSV